MLRLAPWFCFATILLGLTAPPSLAADRVELAASLEVLRAAPSDASSQAAQRDAWRQVAAADVQQLPTILDAMEEAEPIAVNWIRSAADAVAERALATAGELPVDLLEQYVLDAAHPPLGRRVAFQWLVRVEPDARSRLLAQMLDDPSLELRYDAVAELIAQAKSADQQQRQIELYRRAFEAALDVGQIDAIAAALGDRDETVDLIEKMGLLTDWHVIGPFDNTALEGFQRAYPPEEKIDLSAEHPGKSGPVSWKSHATTDAKGIVNLNEVVADEKEVVAYAMADVYADDRLPVEVRFATKNAAKLWVNGQEVAGYEVYHAGYATDQYVAKVVLEPGDNRLLLKICQNEKEHSWEKEWDFQLRVTDDLGRPAPVRLRTARSDKPGAGRL